MITRLNSNADHFHEYRSDHNARYDKNINILSQTVFDYHCDVQLRSVWICLYVTQHIIKYSFAHDTLYKKCYISCSSRLIFLMVFQDKTNSDVVMETVAKLQEQRCIQNSFFVYDCFLVSLGRIKCRGLCYSC